MNRRYCKTFVLALVVFELFAGLSPAATTDDPFAIVEDKPGLARVLLIGDSISIGYTVPVRRALETKANVHRVRANARSTKNGIKYLSTWLDDGDWDVIHFNWGLHDLSCRVDEKTNEKKHQVGLDEYEKNLNELVCMLKATGAKLIWANTTPSPGNGCSNDDVLKYNNVAQKIMKKNGIFIDDLYTFALPRLEWIQREKDVHFTEYGYRVLGRKVTESILEVLEISESSDWKNPFTVVEDKPGLACVLLIGDSISMGYTNPVREVLEGVANVHRIPENGRTTRNTLEKLPKWLVDSNWDVIHFNWGLHDITKKIDEKTGKRKLQVKLDEYEQNLNELINKLKATGAKLIWASTTPVPEGARKRSNENVIKYNKKAKEIMVKNGIFINDLYSFALPQLDRIQREKNVHFTRFGYEVLAQQVAANISKVLEACKDKDVEK